MKLIKLYFLFLFSSIGFAQINIIRLNDVPDSFKEKYYSKPRNYNPLQVGNMWQYYDAEYNVYSTIKVLQDSIINGKKYYKKLYYPEFTTNPDANVIWERNDTTSGVSFMLDFQDVNENGDSLEELPLDSLENPYWSRYKTYKYSFGGSRFWSGEKTTHVKDTSWIIIEGDTVLSRLIEITELFWEEEIAEGFGIWLNWSESPTRYCTGAIINGRQYGKIVNVENVNQGVPIQLTLGNNYPNPFNPSTTINYSIPYNLNNKLMKIKLIIFDTTGREVAVLVDEIKTSGNYSVVFNAQSISSGVYYYSLITDTKRITKPMILLK